MSQFNPKEILPSGSTSRATQAFVKGQHLFHEGHPGDRGYRILSGEVLIYKNSRSKKQISILQSGANDFLGEMDQVDGQYIYHVSAMALTAEVKVEVFFQDELERMLNQASPNTRDIYWSLSQRLRQTTTQFANQQAKHVFGN